MHSLRLKRLRLYLFLLLTCALAERSSLFGSLKHFGGGAIESIRISAVTTAKKGGSDIFFSFPDQDLLSFLSRQTKIMNEIFILRTGRFFKVHFSLLMNIMSRSRFEMATLPKGGLDSLE